MKIIEIVYKENPDKVIIKPYTERNIGICKQLTSYGLLVKYEIKERKIEPNKGKKPISDTEVPKKEESTPNKPLITLPKQLEKEGIRFNLLGIKQKIPLEKDWQNSANYPFGDKKLAEHIEKGGNYGVLCGNGLIVIDADTTELKEMVEGKLMPTFTVSTGKGTHYYYFCKGFDNKKVLKDRDKHLGEIQSSGTYVVGANSIHPTGKRYEVINEIQIMKIDRAVLERAFKKYYTSEGLNKEAFTEGVGEGLRNENMFKIACSLKSKRLNPEETLAVLKSINEKNDPPLPEGELLSVLKSAYKYDDPGGKGKEKAEGIKYEVTELIARRMRSEASELIVETFLNQNHIYTTRNDKKPEMWIYHKGIYIPEGETFIQEFSRECLGELFTTQFCNDVINKIRTDSFIDEKEFFDNNYIDFVPVENGLLNIFTKELSPFDPEKIFFNKLPLVYDPEKDCPNVKKHFNTVLKSEKDVPSMQELFGYLLLKDYRIEKAVMFNGEGRNGKGKTIKLMEMFLGAGNFTSIPLQHLEESEFLVCGLHSKMANLCGDLSKTALRRDGRFKEATGGDPITANRKGKSTITFTNYAKLIFACNELPRSSDLTPAFFNRWQYFDFPYCFLPQDEINKLKEKDKANVKLRDPTIIKKLTTSEELSGLLNWALEGLDRLLKQSNFSSSETWQEVKDMWLRRSDTAMAFILDSVIEAYDDYIIKKDFRKKYAQYCKEHRIKPVLDKSLRNTLTVFGASEERLSIAGNQTYVWSGISFREKEDNELFVKIDRTLLPCSRCESTHSRGWNMEGKKDKKLYCDICAETLISEVS